MQTNGTTSHPDPDAATHLLAERLNELRGLNFREAFEPVQKETLAVAAFLHIHHASDVINKAVEKSLGPYGLSVARYAILRMLSGRAPMPLSWIADKHFSRRSNITAMIDRLVRDGMVERIPDATDRRVIRVGLTPKGMETIQAARAPHLQFVAKLMSPLSDDEQRTLIRIIHKINASLEGDTTPETDADGVSG